MKKACFQKQQKIILFILISCFFFLHSCICAPNDYEPNLENTEQAVRSLFVDILTPPSGQNREGESLLKFASKKHIAAVYYVVNHPEILREIGIPKELEIWLAPIASHLKGIPYSKFSYALNSIADEEFVKYEVPFDEAIRAFRFKGLEALSEIEIPNIGSNWRTFFKSVFKEYFSQLETIDKKRVLSSIIKNTTSKANDIDLLLAAVYGSGPFFQKCMQLLSDFLKESETTPELIALKEKLEKIKSGLPSIEPYFVNQYLKELASKGRKIGIIKSLGAASVGEAFLAQETIEHGNRKETRVIVIKLMRPGIEAIAQRERDFFETQAKHISEMMKKSVDEISEKVFEEMDYRKELEKLRRGLEVYGQDESGPITVVKPLADFPEGKWIAMEFAAGKTFLQARGKLSDAKQTLLQSKLELMSKAILLEMLTRVFIERAFFLEPDGFFHGDLHQGNVILAIDESVYEIMRQRGINDKNLTRESVQELIETKNKDGESLIKLILIDFGNAHYLSSVERTALFNLFISAAKISNSSSAFLDAFSELSSEKKRLKKDHNRLKELLEKSAFSPPDPEKTKMPHERIGDSMDVLLENNFYFPGTIFHFIRAVGLLSNIYKKLQKDTKQQNFCFQKLNIAETLEDAILFNVLWDPKILKLNNLAPISANFFKLNGLDTAWRLLGNPVVDEELKNQGEIPCELTY